MALKMYSDMMMKNRVVRWVQRWGTLGFVAMPLAMVLLLSAVSESKGQSRRDWLWKGRQLTEEAAAGLEKRLIDQPDDVNTRTQLVAYYSRQRYRVPQARQRHEQHLLWLIENNPESDIIGRPEGRLDPHLNRGAFSTALEMLADKSEADPNNLALLSAIARFCVIHDREQGFRALERAIELDPQNGDRLSELGRMHMLEANGPQGADPEHAGKALVAFEQAYELASILKKGRILDDLAKSAFAAGEIEKARRFATQLIAGTENGSRQANSLHRGHTVLGRIALLEGKNDEAKNHLLSSAKIKGSPNLNSFGPNMALAKDFLDQGEKEIVLNYFELCGKFWKRGADRLADWAVLVKGGRVPEFRGNLIY